MVLRFSLTNDSRPDVQEHADYVAWLSGMLHDVRLAVCVTMDIFP